MRRPLDGCRASVKRINAKLYQLEERIARYHASAYKVVADDDLLVGKRVYRLANVVEPPVDISVDITDIANLMRTTLDHLMWVLVEQANGGMVPSELKETLYFPIVEESARFVDARVNAIHNFNRGETAWLRSLQEYNRTNPQERSLLLLNKVVKISKHRYHHSLELMPSSAVSIGVNAIKGPANLVNCEIVVDSISRLIRLAIAHKPDFVDGAAIYTVYPGRHSDAPLPASLPTHPIDLVDIEQSLVAAQPWTLGEWESFFRGPHIKVQVTDKILFGSGSGIAEHMPVIDTLKLIRDYFKRIFADPILSGL